MVKLNQNAIEYAKRQGIKDFVLDVEKFTT